ncbi:hypothetical protein V6N11_052360 [Hibiscus sabdariffa]|uniref:CCHC-type domain-containing protein n=1 Tax=Hibiscus sabdariffa TaxID=183260 RepID=A0ABR2U9T2_9ROSI
METLAVDPRNPKKPRRQDDDPPDKGGSFAAPTPSFRQPTEKITAPNASCKDMLMGESNEDPMMDNKPDDDEDIEILEGDVVRTIVDGLISIQFSQRIQTLAEKSLDRTIVLKLLGRNIGYSTLKNKIQDMWKPKREIKLMDIENGYFLASFYSQEDFLPVLADGPWTVFGHYLTVEPWTPDFSPTQPHPSKVVAWIRLPGLPATLYKRSLIEEIGNCIGPVIRIDYQTENGCRERFARMAIRIDLNKPLVSKLLVNGKIQVVEYESLPTICFNCGKYGHLSETCPGNPSIAKDNDPTPPEPMQPHDSVSSAYGPWMQVDKRQRRPIRKPQTKEHKQADKGLMGSRFNPIYEDDEDLQTTDGLQGDVDVLAPSPTKSIRPDHKQKGKQPTVYKHPRAIHTNHLGKSRHSAVVLSENTEPSPCLVIDAPGNHQLSDNPLILGDPPYTYTNKHPTPAAFGAHQDQAKPRTTAIVPVETYEAEMLD